MAINIDKLKQIGNKTESVESNTSSAANNTGNNTNRTSSNTEKSSVFTQRQNKSNNINNSNSSVLSILSGKDKEDDYIYEILENDSTVEEDPIISREYDENGRLISEKYIDEESGEEFVNNYTYDKNGNNTHIEVIYYGEVKSESNLTYNEQGKLEKKDTIYYTYDNKINATSTDIYDENGNISTNDYIIYNDNNEIVERYKDVFKDGHIFSSFNENYREEHTINSTIYYDENGKALSKYETETDEKGNILFEFQYEADENGYLKEKYIPDYNQEINYTKQGGIGDCWLLSGINNLSYTEAGKEILNNSVSYNDDGSFSIYFKGIDTTINITEEEVQYARESGQYSRGDNDMLVLELAFEAALDKVQNGDIEIKNSHSYLTIDQSEEDKKSIEGGHFEDVIFMLTGNGVNGTNDKTTINAMLDDMENNPEKMAIQYSFSKDFTTEDINGNPISIHSDHAYAVKSVNGDMVILINPWNSAEEIKIPRETLTNNINAGAEYYYFDERNKVCSLNNTEYREDGSINFQIMERYEDNVNIYSYTVIYDEQQNIKERMDREYDEQGKLATIFKTVYNEDGSVEYYTETKFERDEKGNIINRKEIQYDKEGNKISEEGI